MAQKNINPQFVSSLKQFVGKAPYPEHMAMQLSEISLDACEVRIDLDNRHLQPYGIVHGGVIATIIDTATFWAAFLRLPADTGLVNIDLKLNYLNSVMDGQLIARGRCLRPGSRVSYSEAKVYNADDELVAHGTSSLLALADQSLPIEHPKWLD